MSYLAFLQALIVKLTALGPLAPQLIVLIQRQVALFQEFVTLLKGGGIFGAESASVAVNDEILAAENQVIALAEPGFAAAAGDESFGKIGDGSLLRMVYALMVAYPDLAKLLLALLKL